MRVVTRVGLKATAVSTVQRIAYTLVASTFKQQHYPCRVCLTADSAPHWAPYAPYIVLRTLRTLSSVRAECIARLRVGSGETFKRRRRHCLSLHCTALHCRLGVRDATARSSVATHRARHQLYALPRRRVSGQRLLPFERWSPRTLSLRSRRRHTLHIAALHSVCRRVSRALPQRSLRIAHAQGYAQCAA